MKEDKKEAIQKYMDWMVAQPEFKDKLNRVMDIYWSYYSEAEDGDKLALSHFLREEASTDAGMPLQAPTEPVGEFK